LRTLKTLEENPAESGGINGDSGVPFTFELDRLILADDFTPEFQWATLVRHFHEFWRMVNAVGTTTAGSSW